MSLVGRPILKEITGLLEQLRRSERKVAELVLARPEDVIHMRIVDLAAAADVREAGAVIIGLAPGNTPVIDQCTIPIPIDVEPARDDSYSPLPSRIAHLAVIDILAVGVSKMKGAEVDRHLIKLNKGLQSLRTRD